MPAHNPFRNVGRNDPCPCGSGKKFKKCCIGKAELAQIALPDDPFVGDAVEFDDNELIQDYDPFVEPPPDDWLATDEQRRLDMVERYHRREGIDAERAGAHAAIHTAIENQIAEGDRWPVRRTLRRLMAEGLDRHEAIHAIGSVLAVHVNEQLRALRSQAQPLEQEIIDDFNAAYFAEVEKLTAEDWLRSG
jgi:hypothetical protein